MVRTKLIAPLLISLFLSMIAFASKTKVTATPSTATLASGGTQQFTASVNGTNNQSVSWSTTGGAITSTGLFTAPMVNVQTLITVSARNLVGAKTSGTAAVTVEPAPPPPLRTVDLMWQPSNTLGVTSYDIYRKLRGGSYARMASAVTGTSWTDMAVVSGQTYLYVSTAIDGSGESVYSNEVTAMVP